MQVGAIIEGGGEIIYCGQFLSSLTITRGYQIQSNEHIRSIGRTCTQMGRLLHLALKVSAVSFEMCPERNLVPSSYKTERKIDVLGLALGKMHRLVTPCTALEKTGRQKRQTLVL